MNQKAWTADLQKGGIKNKRAKAGGGVPGGLQRALVLAASWA